MKNLLFLFLLSFSGTLFAQDQMFDCGGQQVAVSNVTCTDNVLQFTVTATNLSSYAYISPLPMGSSSTPLNGTSNIFNDYFEISPSGATAVLMIPSAGCTESLNASLSFSTSGPCSNEHPFDFIVEPVVAVSIPTLGQWGIIFLALLIAIGGIITSRKRLLAAE